MIQAEINNIFQPPTAREAIGYIFIFAPASLLAWYTSKRDGKVWADENTTLSVMIGSAIILVGLRLILRPRQFGKVVLAFGVAGAPMVGRKLLLGLEK